MILEAVRWAIEHAVVAGLLLFFAFLADGIRERT